MVDRFIYDYQQQYFVPLCRHSETRWWGELVWCQRPAAAFGRCDRHQVA